jgi:hypothetical protein
MSRPGRFTPVKDPVPIVWGTRWAPGPVWTGAENLVPTGIPTPDRSARSEWLYRLSYPGAACDLVFMEMLRTVWNEIPCYMTCVKSSVGQT